MNRVSEATICIHILRAIVNLQPDQTRPSLEEDKAEGRWKPKSFRKRMNMCDLDAETGKVDVTHNFVGER